MNARSDFANNPLDFAIQQRLKALLDLQGILQRQQLPQEQLKLVRDQVSALAPAPKPASQPLATFPPQTLPSYSPPAAPTPPSQAVQQAMSQPNLASLLNPATLATLIKTTANRQQATPPPAAAAAAASLLSQVQSQVQPASSTPQPSATPVASENPLIASLRARGLLPPSTGTPPSATPPGLPFMIPGQLGFTPPAPTPQGSTDVSIHVHLSTASIKM